MDTKVQGWAHLMGTLPWSMWTVYTWPELGDGESIGGYMCSATSLFSLFPYKSLGIRVFFKMRFWLSRLLQWQKSNLPS